MHRTHHRRPFFGCTGVLAALALLLAPAAGAADTPTPPSASIGGITNVTQTSATIAPSVDTSVDGTFHFDYGTTTSYGASAPVPPLPIGPLPDCHAGGSIGRCVAEQAIEAERDKVTIDSLQPGTTYHVRIAATNVAGTTFGEDQTFTTLPLGPAPAELTPPALSGRSVFGSALTCAPGSWSGATSFAYTWLSGTSVLADGSDPTYQLGFADVGTRIACRVTATSPGDAAASAQTAAELVTAPPPRFAIVSHGARVGRRRATALRVACLSLFACDGRLSLTVRSPARRGRRPRIRLVAHADVRIPALTTATIQLALDRVGAQLLAHAGHGGLHVTATVGGATRAIALSARRR